MFTYYRTQAGGGEVPGGMKRNKRRRREKEERGRKRRTERVPRVKAKTGDA